MENNLILGPLFSLIDDTDLEVYSAVREKLLGFGTSILPELESALAVSTTLQQHDRLELIIGELKKLKLIEKLAFWAQSEDKSLLEGWIIASKVHHPMLVDEKIELLIHKITSEIWVELNEAFTSLEKVSIINHILFDIFKFELNTLEPEVPENCILNNLLVSRKGNLITLSTLYSIIAQRLELPIHVIGIGSYVILGYYGPELAREIHGSHADPYLFYINIENKGAIIGSKELTYVVQKNQEKIEDAELLSKSSIVKKILQSLKRAYQISGNEEKTELTIKLLGALKKPQ
jgi:hypothetical protein